MSSAPQPTHKLSPIATCAPASTARAWQSAAHPYLPLIATASSDKTVRIYSLTSFTLLSTISGGHKRSVRTVAWRPGIRGDKESVLATGSFDAAAGIWKGDNYRSRVGGRIGAAADAEGQADDEDEDMRDAADDGEDWRFAVILEGHESEIKSVAWSCNGTFLATCSRDKSVWIWESIDETPAGANGMMSMRGGDMEDDEDNFETVAVLQEHDGDVKSVAWHPTEEQCLASCSYDDQVRVWREDADGEWGCVAVCEGHEGTVWAVDWEPVIQAGGLGNGAEIQASTADGPVSGPRLVSCSDDLSVRIWKRTPKAKAALPDGPRMPSIIRSTGDEEEWYEEQRLPQRHQRSVYAVAWSKQSGRIVTAGSDGKIVVYEEDKTTEVSPNTDAQESGTEAATAKAGVKPTSWSVVAEIEASHGEFEVNHVCWTKRYDKGKQGDSEEVIVSTGDDGEVKVWSLSNM